MTVREAKDVARQWAMDKIDTQPGLVGAFFHGSINWLPDEAVLPPASDVDVMVVVNRPDPPKLGKFLYRDVLLEISYLSSEQFKSPEQALGNYHLAGSFRRSSVIVDPSGHLNPIQAAVSRDFAKRAWVVRRCEHARRNVLEKLDSLRESVPFYDQVNAWLFGTGVLTHILLVAGLKNPTVRKRYLDTWELLAEYGRLDFHERLLEMLGCAHLGPSAVERHLDRLASVFDETTEFVRPSHPFAADLTQAARPVAIDGSYKLIEKGNHREAVFWMVATWSRCQRVLAQDAPEGVLERSNLAYRTLLRDLGISSFEDLRSRSEQVRQLLPRVWETAEAIIATNPAIGHP